MGGHQAVRSGALAAVLDLEGETRTPEGDQPRSDARLLQLGVQATQRLGGIRALRLQRADPLAEVEDVRLERLLLRLQPERRLDERRSLLRRVADARALRGDLRGDQEAQDQQCNGERELHARQRPQAPDDDAHRSSGSCRSPSSGMGSFSRSGGAPGDGKSESPRLRPRATTTSPRTSSSTTTTTTPMTIGPAISPSTGGGPVRAVATGPEGPGAGVGA